MAITLAVHVPMVEAMRGVAESRAQLLAARYPHDSDAVSNLANWNFIQRMLISLAANDDTAFEAVATVLGVGP